MYLIQFLKSILETLRKYPVVPILNRECTENYKVPGSSYTMQKGTAILIPILGLQRDPKYYPKPDEFIPERFSPENSKSFEEMPVSYLFLHRNFH